MTRTAGAAMRKALGHFSITRAAGSAANPKITAGTSSMIRTAITTGVTFDIVTILSGVFFLGISDGADVTPESPQPWEPICPIGLTSLSIIRRSSSHCRLSAHTDGEPAGASVTETWRDFVRPKACADAYRRIESARIIARRHSWPLLRSFPFLHRPLPHRCPKEPASSTRLSHRRRRLRIFGAARVGGGLGF